MFRKNLRVQKNFVFVKYPPAQLLAVLLYPAFGGSVHDGTPLEKHTPSEGTHPLG